MAGSDTTATAIRSVMMFLAASPSPYMKLKMEIKEAIEQNTASSPITQEQAKKLPYLQVSAQFFPTHLYIYRAFIP